MAEETRSGAPRRPTLQEVELAEQAVRSAETRLIEDELRAQRGDQRVHGPSYVVVRTVAETRAELQRLLAAREARRILTDSDTIAYSRGPLSIECDLARKLGWTEQEIENAALALDDRASLFDERAAARQGRTMRCVRCDQWSKPPEPCSLPSSGVCEKCLALPTTDELGAASASDSWSPSPRPWTDLDRTVAAVRGSPAGTPGETLRRVDDARTMREARLKLIDRKRVVVVALEKVETAERDLVAAGLSTVQTGGSFTEGAYAQGVVFGTALRFSRARDALAGDFREEEIAEARVARAMGLASTLLRQFSKTLGISSERQHRAVTLADWLQLGAPEAFDAAARAIPDDAFSSALLVHLEAVCPDGHTKLLVSGPVGHLVPVVGPPRVVTLTEDQRAHVLCRPTALPPLDCGKPLTLRLRFELCESKWQTAPD